MTTVRITSNPYKREILFETLRSTSDEWIEINAQNNPDSELIKDDIVKNFFPYKAKQIIGVLKKEYLSGSDKLELFFDGTADEYNELIEICADDDGITLQRDNRGLENARDILPKIVDIFSDIEPIVHANISSDEVRMEIERDIAKFTDASNDVVPICVLGNYSSGKSTFINALIGMEILPSGDMPVTAKIYRIRQSSDVNVANVSLKFDEKSIEIDVIDNQFRMENEEDSVLSTNLSSAFEMHQEASLASKVNACLNVINTQREDISDLIDITVPFGNGALTESKNTFVIFDTPGSNTATYKDHFSILEGAMKNLSNGILIYVAEYNSLDSCDNDSLYEKIKSISQIDSRFTMIVVNKADSANIKENSFDEEMQNMILSQAVPRNLYSGGIYFISSIMGLGSKNEGEFFDDHSAEFFEDNERKYSDATSKRYKSLYKYNIMPGQIKQSITNVAEVADNKIYANSGMLAIEQEIVDFAEKYSAYDKCKQSDKYIGRILAATQEEINKIKANREDKKTQLERELEEDKKALISLMEDKSSNLSDSYNTKYESNLDECVQRHRFAYTVEDIKILEEKLLLENREEHKYSDRQDSVKEQGTDIINAFSGIGKKAIGEVLNDIKAELGEAKDSVAELHKTKVEIDKETADELIKAVSDDYNGRRGVSIKDIDSSSKQYWERNAEAVKKELSLIVANSTTLDEAKKKELEQIIINYGDIAFDGPHEFEKTIFAKKIWLPGRVINLNKINTKKLTDEYNKLYTATLDSSYEKTKRGHSQSFEAWLQQLVDKIRSNIVSYSPKLSEQAQRIADETKKIEELEKTKDMLNGYSEEIQALMGWKVLV